MAKNYVSWFPRGRNYPIKHCISGNIIGCIGRTYSLNLRYKVSYTRFSWCFLVLEINNIMPPISLFYRNVY